MDILTVNIYYTIELCVVSLQDFEFFFFKGIIKTDIYLLISIENRPFICSTVFIGIKIMSLNCVLLSQSIALRLYTKSSKSAYNCFKSKGYPCYIYIEKKDRSRKLIWIRLVTYH